ncbi:transglycosylase domain-containing protein [Nocardioides sp. Kera G14]|uniref:transglycosylase domain-containing protein n=1 Tax=Nocardioides sp. Kera G14 TaxID=2884264 RepID=UPI001D12268C|nr:transglycosylase domain-containing protein [Nocardioides sp. Kera G14]UDY23741.1 penicillin-binding protein [Nocardioides sp. Kera G14]
MSRPAEHRELVLTRLAVMAAVAVILGVVIALLVIPFAGVAGIGARNVARSMTNLPASLETGELSQRSRIVDANGKLITTMYDENRITRPLSQISRTMVQAIVSIEDYRFYQHGALDLKGTLRAFVTNQANSGVVQGGSSITQQLVKLTLLSQAQATGDEAKIKAATDDTYARKLQELRYAIALEQTHTKDWILERYLNTAYFGDGAFGVQAAAKHYFNVNSDKLSLTQAATLAGLVKNPTGYDPTNSPDRAVARRNVVLDRMAQLNVITDDEAKTAKDAPLGLEVQKAQNGCVNASAPFFCDYVLRRLLDDPALGKTVEERRKLLNNGGLTIKTTLNLSNQKAADNSTSGHVGATDQAIGAIAEVEPGTGNVLALSQSRPMGRSKKKGETYLNYTVPKEYGDANGFQAGSTFKAFVLATAIRDGVGLNTTISARSPMEFPVSAYKNCEGAPAFAGEDWKVGNSTTSGNMTLYTGTRLSVNTFFAQLEQVTGVCDPFNLAKSMGLFLTNPKYERLPSFTLGVVDVSPLEMAGAYATFGARGLYCSPRPVTEIDDAAGNPIKSYPTDCKQVLPKEVADGVNDVLRGVQEPGGFGYDLGHTNLQTADGTVIPSAGKTGTTQDGKSVWFMGFTPQIATAAMIAGANSLGSPIPLGGQTIHGNYISGSAVSGSGFAGPMWADAMHPIQDELEPQDFTAPPETMKAATQDKLSDIKVSYTPPVSRSSSSSSGGGGGSSNKHGRSRGRGH